MSFKDKNSNRGNYRRSVRQVQISQKSNLNKLEYQNFQIGIEEDLKRWRKVEEHKRKVNEYDPYQFQYDRYDECDLDLF